MGSVQADALSRVGPEADEISRQTERVLLSAEFHSPERGRRFLRFVIDETLAGRSQFLKAFTIANEIFGRETSFDAQNDPVVRIEASRIRRALERYYLVAGQDDEIIITIPKGGYVPHFEYAHVASKSEPTSPVADKTPRRLRPRTWRPTTVEATVAVLLVAAASFCVIFGAEYLTMRPAVSETPTREASGTVLVVDTFDARASDESTADIAHDLRDEVISQLTAFGGVLVVSDPSRANERGGTGYVLQANVQIDGNLLRAVARLVRRSDATVIWARSYDADLRKMSKLEIQGDLAQKIALAVAQPYGAIFRMGTDTIAGNNPQ